MAGVVRVARDQNLYLGESFLVFLEALQDDRAATPSVQETGGPLQATGQKRLGIRVPTQAQFNIRQQAHRGNLSGDPSQVLLKQATGHVDPSVVRGARCLDQDRVLRGATDMLEVGGVGAGCVTQQKQLIAERPPGFLHVGFESGGAP